MERKRLIGVIVLVVLLAAIPLTIYLVKQTQIFQPRAGDVTKSRIDIYQGGTERLPVGTVPAIVTNPNVQLKIYYVPSPSP